MYRIALAVMAIALAIGPVCSDKQTIKLAHRVFKSQAEAQQQGSSSLRGTGLIGEPYDLGNGLKVAWPTLKCKKPLYGYLSISVPDPKNPGQDRTEQANLVLDQSGKTPDTYDILYIDLNCDGKFGDGERVVGTKPTGTAATSSGREISVDYGVVALPIGLPGHETEHVAITFTKDDTGGAVYYCPACLLEGEMQTASGPRALRIVDESFNGSFADYGSDMVILGNERQVLSKIISVDNAFSNFQIAPDGSSFTISPYTGETGKVAFDVKLKSAADLQISGQARSSDVTLSLGLVSTTGLSLPARDYPQSYIYMQCKDGDLLWVAYTSMDVPIHVAANETTTVKAGSPMSLEVVVNGATSPGATADLTYTVKGVSGESYSRFINYRKDGTNYTTVGAKAIIMDAAGKQVVEATLEPG